VPFVNINILEGTSDMQKQKIVEDITNTFQKNVGVSKDKVFIFFTDLKKNNYGKNGSLASNSENE